MIIEAIALGLVLGLLFYETVGFSPGGMIVPGYLALFLLEPWRVVGTLAVAVATFAVIRVLGEWLILYGRRRFVLTVLVGFALARAAEAMPLPAGIAPPDLRVIGFVVPGLIANDIEHQGVPGTVLSVLAVAGVVRLILAGLSNAGLLA